jgi:5'-nucleotidase
MTRKGLRSWVTHAALAALAVGVVVAAPLASTKSAARDTVIISGARSISDQVAVTFQKPSSHPTTDVHLLAFNDLHGTLEPGGNNIYGKFAGGVAYLAKAVEGRLR